MAKKKACVKPKTTKKPADIKKIILQAKKKSRIEFKKAKAKLIKAEKDIEKFIEKNPKKAAAIAAGVGATIAAGITAALTRHKKKK